jgi:nucleotide-binding universal stress UspA family protein
MKRFKNILCVVTAGNAGETALDRAVTPAENNQAGLTVVAVSPRLAATAPLMEGGPLFTDQLQEKMVAADAQTLEGLVEPYRARVTIQTRILVGVAFLEIIREVLRNNRDLVIKAPDTQAWLARVFTSDDMHLLRKCPSPVWLTRPCETKGYRLINRLESSVLAIKPPGFITPVTVEV